MPSWKDELTNALQCAVHKEDYLVYQNCKAKLVSYNEPIQKRDDVDFIIHQHWWELRPEILVSRIKSKFGLIEARIFGRKLRLEKITTPESKTFINEHHLMGWGGGQISYALIDDKEIIAVAVFSKGRKMKYENPPYVSAELIRFSCKKGVHVVGGLDKLMQHYFRSKQVDEIITYVDKDWSDGSSFARIGFEKIEDAGPRMFEYDPIQEERIPINQVSKKDVIHSSGSIKMRMRKT